MKIRKLYKIYIYEKYKDLINSGKNIDNNDLWKIFEWLSCIKLTEEYQEIFYEYNDIDPTFKEENKMSKNDTGIDACNLIDTIVQCKLRKDTLTWKDCSTFFGSQNIFDKNLKKTIVKWEKLIITRNSECKLSENLLERSDMFIDKTYSTEEIIEYCNNLIENPPKYPKNKNLEFELRDYQKEAIEIINNNKNVIISLPTGTGKNCVIIYSLVENQKYLILVPRIILMEQLKDEIIKHKPEFKNTIQTIGDNKNKYNQSRNIIICVYNSVSIIEPYFSSFHKIFIDEAHHINIPEIYYDDNIDIDNYEEKEDDVDNDDDDSDTEELKDDTEDEIKNTTGYNKIIKSLSKYDNNVYLSATIDAINDFTYYNKDIRDMIEKKHLCDYMIKIPIFSDDPSNKNICEYLIHNYRNIIVYCNSQKEGIAINILLNTLQKGCSMYIDCHTKKKDRNDIINKYKNGDIPFLVNVRILVEGFDSPITKGVMFMHLPSSKTTLIQIIGRALRLHPLKTIANIILPFSSKEDEKNINNFMKIMAKNDRRIKQSFENKILGGYINIECHDIEDNDDIKFRYEMIYNNMGILQNGEEIWMKRLQEVKDYIDEHKKKPSSKDKDLTIKKLGRWISNQLHKYKNNIMKNEEFYNKWTQFISNYKEYFQSNEEIWCNSLEQVINYIDTNKKRPSTTDKNKEIKLLGNWCSSQQDNYKKCLQIMKNQEIYDKWTEFINDDKYKEYFLSNKEKWLQILEKVKNFININNKKPTINDKDNNIKFLGRWLINQKTSYKYRKDTVMTNQDIYDEWTKFINDDKYKEYIISNEDKWLQILEKVKCYINNNNTKPTINDKNNDIKFLGSWLNDQFKYHKKENVQNQNIYDEWTKFINDDKYNQYLKSNEDKWCDMLNKLKEFMNKYNYKPIHSNKDDYIRQLGQWLYDQQRNYKNKKCILSNQLYYNKWMEFITDVKYKQYF